MQIIKEEPNTNDTDERGLACASEMPNLSSKSSSVEIIFASKPNQGAKRNGWE